MFPVVRGHASRISLVFSSLREYGVRGIINVHGKQNRKDKATHDFTVFVDDASERHGQRSPRHVNQTRSTEKEDMKEANKKKAKTEKKRDQKKKRNKEKERN
jgi:hypothetical protein